jgi:signal transduction histidine kinase
MQDTVVRYGWPLVVLMLVATLVTVGSATYQSHTASSQTHRRDAATAAADADFTARYLANRLADQSAFLASNASVLQSGSTARIRSLLNDQYLKYAPGYVLGVVVTDQHGRGVLASERQPGLIESQSTVAQLEAVARDATGHSRPAVSGVLSIAGHRAYAQASPVSGVEGGHLGAWVVVYDAQSSPLGELVSAAHGRDVPHPTIVDDRGLDLLGSMAGVGASGATHGVSGTTWQVLVPSSPTPAGVPVWAFMLIVAGTVLLGAFYWLQEGTRRTLHEEAAATLLQAHRLYTLASDLLHAGSSREQAQLLASAVVEGAGLDAARVRVARDRDPHGIVVGDSSAATDELGWGGVRSYRLAIAGAREMIGELVAYRADGERVSDEQRHVARTMGAIAGAAVHTFSVLERERENTVELQRIDELRTNLLSTVAHELRSPLTAVKGVLGLLSMQDSLAPKHREYVEVATQRTDALVDLIRDLFDCSLLESGQLDIRPERCLATDLLDRALGALAASRGDEIILSATPNLKVTVDPLRFDQIVNNLVTNATRHGAPPIEVELRPYRDGACLIVSDNGPGIPREERARIFSKFYQSDSGHARLVEGAGLGLALVAGLVRLHGGRIEVDSVRLDGRGARFRVYLPDVAAPPDEQRARERALDPLLLDVPDGGEDGLRSIV